MDKIVESVMDAITASGKKFNEIDKKSIFNFLENKNISPSKWELIYEILLERYSIDSKEKKAISKKASPFKSKGVVDYSDSSHNDVKDRNPRKSIFYGIKKIAG